jgi:hypothetical protein
MYDPRVGRWLLEDSIGLKAGDANLYRYVKNSPTNATDPSGLQQKNGQGQQGVCKVTKIILVDNDKDLPGFLKRITEDCAEKEPLIIATATPFA